jgi:hypothetical protein
MKELPPEFAELQQLLDEVSLHWGDFFETYHRRPYNPIDTAVAKMIQHYRELRWGSTLHPMKVKR